MNTKKKIVLGAFAFYILGGTAAYAQVGVQLNVGTPAYIAPPPAAVYAPAPPVYVSPYPTYYDPWHRTHDFQYWRDRRGHEHHDDEHFHR